MESYQVELDLTGGEITFGSVTTVRFGCARPGASTFIDLTAPEVSDVMLNGRTLAAGRLRRQPDRARRPGRVATS